MLWFEDLLTTVPVPIQVVFRDHEPLPGAEPPAESRKRHGSVSRPPQRERQRGIRPVRQDEKETRRKNGLAAKIEPARFHFSPKTESYSERENDSRSAAVGEEKHLAF